MAANEWLESHAQAIGTALAVAPALESSYALGALLPGPPWSVTVLARWGDLVAPWLTKNAVDLAARHLLYRGLRHVPTGHGPGLIDAALRWSAVFVEKQAASYVIGPLIEREELSQVEEKTALGVAFSWVRLHGSEVDARFVIGPLLARKGLSEIEWNAASEAVSA